MGKKRKSVASSLDEVDRTMYSTFCSAANSLSQLYTQTMNQQKLSFQAGERHGLEKLYQWILRQEEGGSRVSTVNIVNYLQDQLDFCGEDPSMTLRVPVQHQHSQPTTHFMNTGFFVNSGSSGSMMAAGQGTRTEHLDHQSRNSVFSNALSSPVRRSLQHSHFTRGGCILNNPPLSGNGSRNSELNQNREVNSLSSNDSSMDMHADSPGHDSTH